jgi:hypothetical protein
MILLLGVNTIGLLNQPVQLSRRLLLHRRQHVRVRVEREADLGVPESLLDDLRMNALGYQQRGRPCGGNADISMIGIPTPRS